MSSVPAGKRSWKCPECGTEVLLSVTQLDPIACDACVARMKSAGRSGSATDALKSLPPVGIWLGLSETVKAGLIVLGLVAGLGIGFVAGRMTAPVIVKEVSHSRASTSEATHPESLPEEDLHEPELKEDRPAPPGPGFKWVQGRKRKDGTRGDGHWAKDPRYKEGDSAKP